MNGFRDLNLKFSLDLAIYEQFEFHVEHEKSFITSGPGFFIDMAETGLPNIACG